MGAGKGEALPFGEGSFDVLLLFTALEFVEDAERVLRPGGALLVGILEGPSPWAALYRRLGEKGVRPWTHVRFLTQEDLASLLGPPEAEAEAAFLAPEASPPFPEADHPALYLGRWR